LDVNKGQLGKIMRDLQQAQKRNSYLYPLRLDMGGNTGYFIFTDRGGDRIERAAFGRVSGDVRNSGAYDIIRRRVSVKDLGQFVAERDPKRIGVNFSEKMDLADGISYVDYNQLVEALGDTYADKMVSAEFLIIDFLTRRVTSELVLFGQSGPEWHEHLEREFAKVVPGVTKLSDLDGNVFRRNPDGREFHADDPDPYVLQRGDLFTILNGAHGRNFYGEVSGNAYLLKEGETEAPPEIKEVWKHAMKVREILKENIKAGRTAGDTLDLLIRKIEEAGYFYNPVDYWDKDADQQKTQIHLDCHAVGRNEFVGPRISPFGPDWLRNMKIPVLHTFTFEYMVHMPVPKWGKGKHLYIVFHDGAVVTEDGVVFPYPSDQGIRIIR
jgi:hypothetical protein